MRAGVKMGIMVGLIASCGSGSGSNSSGSNNTAPTESTGEQTTGNDFEISGDTFSISIDGQTFESAGAHRSFIKDQPLPWSSNEDNRRQMFIAIESKHQDSLGCSASPSDAYVCGLAVAFYKDGVAGSGFGLIGDPASNPPSGQVSYSGYYAVADARTYPGQRLIVEDIDLTANFNSGTVSGTTPNPFSPLLTVNVNGQISGSELSLRIDGPLGVYDAEGGFFGPNGEELAAGFSQGGVTGLLYGLQQ